jgi:DNA polymerase-3 subunit beta
MKFTCEREVVLHEIANAYEIISVRNSLSILSNVLLDVSDQKLTIRATDLKVNYESTIPVEVKQPGSVTVFCDKLHSILRSLPDGEVEMELLEDTVLRISPMFKNIRFQLKGISADKYPPFQGAEVEGTFPVAKQDLIEMISHTLFAVSDDETRYFMNGVYLEKQGDQITMVATDGRRLAYASKTMESSVADFKGVIIPPKLLNILRRQAPREGEFQVAVSEREFHVRYESQKLASNLIDAQFPNYQRVIPDRQEHRLVIDRAAFEEGLRRVALLVEQKSRRIYLESQSDNLVIRSSEGEIGAAREEIECEYQGPELVLAFNYEYLLDPLREMSTDQVVLEFTDTGKALSLKPEPEGDFFHIVMPMQAS